MNNYKTYGNYTFESPTNRCEYVCMCVSLKSIFLIDTTHVLIYNTQIKNVKRLIALCLRKILLKFFRFVVCV